MRAKFARLIAGAVVMLGVTPAWAIDVGPGDYRINPAGTNIGLLYLQHQSADAFKLNGSDVPASELEVNVAVLRALHFTEAYGMPAMVQAVLPVIGFSSAEIGGIGQGTSEGVGDLTLGFTVWPVKPDNPETGTTLGFTMHVTAPTGNYDVNEISAGSGAWTITPQVGLNQGLGGGYYFDAYFDAAFSFDHDESGMTVERDPAYQLQAYIRKQFSPKTSLSAGVSLQRGGKVKIGGVDTGLRTERDQLRVYANTFVTPTMQIQGMLAKDFNVSGGFENDHVFELRFLKLF